MLTAVRELVCVGTSFQLLCLNCRPTVSRALLLCAQLLTASVKLFFKRPPEMQVMLGRLFKKCLAEATSVSLHDRALLYYRILTKSPREAADVIGSKKGVSGTFLEDRLDATSVCAVCVAMSARPADFANPCTCLSRSGRCRIKCSGSSIRCPCATACQSWSLWMRRTV